MGISEEQALARAEASAEMRRRLVAASACASCAVAAAFILLVMVRFPGHLSDTILRVLLGLVLAIAIVLGARSLDGPIRMREKRRDQGSASDAAAALMLWLGCFAAIMTAFFVSDVVTRIDASRVGTDAGRQRPRPTTGSRDVGRDRSIANEANGMVAREQAAGAVGRSTEDRPRLTGGSGT